MSRKDFPPSEWISLEKTESPCKEQQRERIQSTRIVQVESTSAAEKEMAKSYGGFPSMSFEGCVCDGRASVPQALCREGREEEGRAVRARALSERPAGRGGMGGRVHERSRSACRDCRRPTRRPRILWLVRIAHPLEPRTTHTPLVTTATLLVIGWVRWSIHHSFTIHQFTNLANDAPGRLSSTRISTLVH